MEMSVKKYRVKLTTEERQELKALVSRGRAAAYKQTHAPVLLLSDAGQGDGAMKDEEIARALRIGEATVERVRRRPRGGGCRAALERRVQIRRRRKKLDGQGEAHPVSSTGQALIGPGLRRTAAGTRELRNSSHKKKIAVAEDSPPRRQSALQEW